MSAEIKTLHEPFAGFLKAQGLVWRRSRPDRKTSEKRGEPDFLVMENGKVLAIEFKDKNAGKPSPYQVIRHAEYERAGCHVYVLRDLQSAINIVNEWRTQAPDPPRRAENTVAWKGMTLRRLPDGSMERLVP